MREPSGEKARPVKLSWPSLSGWRISSGTESGVRSELLSEGNGSVLQDLAGGRVKHHQVVRLAGRDEQPAVGTERDGLRPHARQLDLSACGGEDLISGCIVAVWADLTHGFTR